jgi:hypothetical protein
MAAPSKHTITKPIRCDLTVGQIVSVRLGAVN